MVLEKPFALAIFKTSSCSCSASCRYFDGIDAWLLWLCFIFSYGGGKSCAGACGMCSNWSRSLVRFVIGFFAYTILWLTFLICGWYFSWFCLWQASTLLTICVSRPLCLYCFSDNESIFTLDVCNIFGIPKVCFVLS